MAMKKSITVKNLVIKIQLKPRPNRLPKFYPTLDSTQPLLFSAPVCLS